MKEVFNEIWVNIPSWGKYAMIGITALVGALIYLAAHFSPQYKKDNPVEQAVEKIIKAETGLDVDLSSQLENGKQNFSTK